MRTATAPEAQVSDVPQEVLDAAEKLGAEVVGEVDMQKQPCEDCPPEEAAAAPAPTTEAGPPSEPPLDAVIVIREEKDGQINTRVVTNGDVRVTEVETLLKLGLQGWQKQIGV
jgi:hypothetical protein